MANEKQLPTKQMSAEDFVKAREDLGATLSEIARFLNLSNTRTVRRYEDDEAPVSGPVSVLMQVFVNVPGAYEFAGRLARERAKEAGEE